MSRRDKEPKSALQSSIFTVAMGWGGRDHRPPCIWYYSELQGMWENWGKTQSHNYSLHQHEEVAKSELGFLCTRNGLGLVNCFNFPKPPICLLLNILCTFLDTEVGYKNETMQKDTAFVSFQLLEHIFQFLCISQWLLTVWSVAGFLQIPQPSRTL